MVQFEQIDDAYHCLLLPSQPVKWRCSRIQIQVNGPRLGYIHRRCPRPLLYLFLKTLAGFYVFFRVDSDAEGEWRKLGSSASGLLACDTVVCWAEYKSSLGTLLQKLRGVIDTHFLVHDPCSLTPNAPRLGCEAMSVCGSSLYVLQSLKKTAYDLGRVLCVSRGSF